MLQSGGEGIRQKNFDSSSVHIDCLINCWVMKMRKGWNWREAELLATIWPMPSQPLSNGSPSKLSPWAFIADHNAIWSGAFLWSVWDQLSCLCSLPPGVPPASLLAGQHEKQKKTLTPCKHCSARNKTLVYYQHCFHHEPRTQWQDTGHYEEN